MKSSICILIVIIFFSSCSSLNKEDNNASDLSIITSVKGNYIMNNENFYLVDLKIFNPGKGSVKFWAYDCSYLFNISLDSEIFELSANLCNTNSPNLFELKPKQFIEVPIVIKKRNKISKNIDLKIGFILVKEDQFSFGMNYFNILSSIKKSGNQIIWSKKIYLFPGTGNPYK